MDFYRINEEYNKFLQRYEKEKEELRKYRISGIQTVISLHLVLLCK